MDNELSIIFMLVLVLQKVYRHTATRCSGRMDPILG